MSSVNVSTYGFTRISPAGFAPANLHQLLVEVVMGDAAKTRED